MHSTWKIVAGALIAGIFSSCDRAAQERPVVEQPIVERSAVQRPEAASPKIQANLPPVALPSPEPRVAEPAPKQFDPAPQMAPALQLDRASSTPELQFAQMGARSKPADNARAIFAVIQTLPPEVLASAAGQAVEQLPDADYAPIALPVLANPQTHGQVLSVMFADLLERPETIALPALLTIAKNSDHSFAPAALDDLRLLLKADYGGDWPRWDAAIREKLAAGR